MNSISKPSVSDYYASGQHQYPRSHWPVIQQFVEGLALDPKGLFRLADDIWEAWPYAENARPTGKSIYTFRFGHLNSWIKPYVKWYCYQRLIGEGGSLKRSLRTMPYYLSQIDQYLIKGNYESLYDIALPSKFEALWDSLITLPEGHQKSSLLSESAVSRQEKTRPFWMALHIQFGLPQVVPPTAPHEKRTPAEFGEDESRVIPNAVIRQLVNKLALHREGVVHLSRYDHLRLCVLMLMICSGRRSDEVLASPRCSGPDGPLERYPCRHEVGELQDALWFRMCPNKGGPSEWVYISSQWENLVTYCVHQLIHYGDEVRLYSRPEEQGLLVLISTRNWTTGPNAKAALFSETDLDFSRVARSRSKMNQGLPKRREPHFKNLTTGISYAAFNKWLNGNLTENNPLRPVPGVMTEWKITEDGLADGPIYRLLTNRGRHTRQTALARDQQIPPLTKQRDLNHRSSSEQIVYQHVLKQENESLIKQVIERPLLGKDLNLLNKLLGLDSPENGSEDKSPYRRGLVQLYTPSWREIVDNNPTYFEDNLIALGICGDSDGPCDDYRRSEQVRQGNGAVRRKTGESKSTTGRQTKPRSQRQHAAETLPPTAPGNVLGQQNDQQVDRRDIVKRLKGHLREVKENG